MQLRRKQIRQIFAQNPGSASALARQLGVSRVTVGMVLRGRTKSKRVLDAALQIALELEKTTAA